uniref:Endonuclease/exonuclease/phosphatase domain-containing protein n=1 Tax=Chromera velia CCMP2878 TaxID=1169474 RepID=A0A0G4FFR1_9ALVE|eukprot:Cvel_16735.t1-p1 / transcript=Cvel_16735.t1 / gene=Cvel_16735 / organism=Chromera_velia_CCMP2878 / gene_product=hypothetical protein / transcript_product=hypothetical protein / location=Cvel_scaffold1302:14705-16180(+) / protein_length=323 / sequence_SO=supercontig / SO=protein_coding / is_pseudo=false
MEFSEGNQQQLRVLQYNLQSGVGIDGKYDLSRSCRVINALDVHVAALQEVSKRCERDCYGKPLQDPTLRDADQPSEIERLTKKTSVFYSKTEDMGGEFGTAVLVDPRRCHLKSSQVLRLKTWETHHKSNLFFGKLPQVAIVCRVRPSGFSRDVLFVGTHLGCDASGCEQAAEMEEVLDWVEQLKDNANEEENSEPKGIQSGNRSPSLPLHVVIAGDMNAPGFFKAVKVPVRRGYKDAWLDSRSRKAERKDSLAVSESDSESRRSCCPCRNFRRRGATFRSDMPLTRLDYIFISPGLRTVSAQVVQSKASDHFPLLCVLEEKRN